MIRSFLGGLLGAALVSATIVVTGCGSGAVSSPPTTPTIQAITITPASATLFSNLPTTFLLSGGNGNYVITSNNQAVIANATTSNNTLTVVPSDVTADTTVTITVSDTSGNTPVSASLVVKPRTISNVVTVTPSASQSAVCGTSVCSGGDASVRVVMSQNGVALAGRPVRFDVVSGDVRFITSAAGAPETLSLSSTTTTDSVGAATIRIRVLADATAQTAILQVTDTTSGFTQRASVSIAPASNAPLTALPTAINFTGVNSHSCANNISADVIVVGGRPPYLVTQPSGFVVTPQVLTSNGGRVTVTATGQCTSNGLTDPGQTISIVDSNGAIVNVVVHNSPAPVTPQTAAFAVSPTSVTLDSCDAIANIASVGGAGAASYFAASGNKTLIDASVSGNIGQIRRVRPSPATIVNTVIVTFSDGQTTKDVTVTLTGPGQGPC